MSSKIFNYNGVNSFLPFEQSRPSNPMLLNLNAKPTTHTLKQSSFRNFDSQKKGGALFDGSSLLRMPHSSNDLNL